MKVSAKVRGGEGAVLAVVAAAAVVAIVNVISYAAGVKPNWLAVAVSLAYMVGGYAVNGRTTPAELFLAVVYGLLMWRRSPMWTGRC